MYRINMEEGHTMYHYFKLEGVQCETIFTHWNRICRNDVYDCTAVILEGPLKGYEVCLPIDRWLKELDAYEYAMENQGDLPL
jgi:hypothetical protein